MYDYFWVIYFGDLCIESIFLIYWKFYVGVGKGEKFKEEFIVLVCDIVYVYFYFIYIIKGEEKFVGWKKFKLYVGWIFYEKLVDLVSLKVEEFYVMIVDMVIVIFVEKGYLKGLLFLLENVIKKLFINIKLWFYFKKLWDFE